jgi:hypothetical protein
MRESAALLLPDRRPDGIWFDRWEVVHELSKGAGISGANPKPDDIQIEMSR